MNIIGIDPGNAGGIAILNDDNELTVYKMPQTFTDIYDTISEIKQNFDISFAVMEEVGHGMPGQSSKATATFARHNGHLEMALYACGIRTVMVTPQRWQKALHLGSSKGKTKVEWKNHLRNTAQLLHPSIKVFLWDADAILIAEYGRTIQ